MTVQDLRISPVYETSPRLSLITSHSVVLKATGLKFISRSSYHSWEALGEQLFAIADSSAWWIADWLVYGESIFLDRYQEAIKKTQLNYQTLRNYAWVARRFDVSRRRENLTFGHHAEVAALDQPEQDYWLRKAEEHNWSRNRLRSEVRASWRERRSEPARDSASANPVITVIDPDNPMKTVIDPSNSRGIPCHPNRETIQLWLMPDQVNLYKSIADDQNMSLDEWVIGVLNVAAGYDCDRRPVTA